MTNRFTRTTCSSAGIACDSSYCRRRVKYWLWHSFRDVVRRVVHVADVASVILCAVRS
jgi:hypothetical protein